MMTREALSPIQHAMIDIGNQIADKVGLAMRNTGYRQLQTLNVRVDGGEVCLQGCLPSYYLKQIAQHAVLAVPGVRAIVDDIVVMR